MVALTLGARAEADVILFPSQPSYDVGERVEFTLVNATEHVLSFPQATWWKIHDSQGELVEGCEVAPTELEMAPGDSHTWYWDQVHCAKETPVPPGRYRLNASYGSECCPGQTFAIEAYFDIGAAPVAPASWGRIKALFEQASR
jgi:hypothetical protein